MNYHVQYRRIAFAPTGERIKSLNSNWYEDEAAAVSLLNDEYPLSTSTGWWMRLEKRYVSDIVSHEPERKNNA
jgi:hypothetical protein